MKIKNNYLILCLIFFIIYFSNALFLSFFQVFLIDKGFNESKVGIISAITPLLCILVNPMYSLFGKNNKRIRYLLQVLCFLEALVILLIYKVNEFSLLILTMCLVAIVDPPLFIILDSYTSTYVKENNKNYSYIRMIGTLSYAIGAFIAGIIIEKLGYSIIFISAAILMFISTILVLFLKNNNNQEERKKGEIKQLLNNKPFIIFAIYFIFILSFQLLGDTYISVYLTTEKGIEKSSFGIINAAWVLLELLVIIILNKFKIINERVLLIIMGICYLLRFITIGLNAPKELIIFSALLRGISMAIYIYLYIPILNKIIKPSNISIALLSIAMFKSLFSTIMISITGIIIDKIGYELIFIIWSLIFLVVILGYYIFSKKFEIKKIASFY